MIVANRARIPSGTVTFLFTDIAGSTTRWERFGDAMRDAVAAHDALLARVFAEHDAHVFKTLGDAFCVAFHSVGDAVAAAIAAQRELAGRDWSAVDGLGVRMAIHVGTTDERDGDYFGPVVNRVARLLSTAHGGQIVLSAAARALAESALPPDASLRDLGSHRLKDLSQPETIAQLTVRGLRGDFPPLNSLESGKTNLPQHLAPLIGRTADVERIVARVRAKPLVTLCGAGGIGKTRIACQVGAEMLGEFADGVWFIDLAPITEASLMPGVLAATFNVPDVGLRNVAERVVAYLAPKNLLLILDNCEQIVAAAAGIVNAILHACKDVRVLVTTREALHVGGEDVHRVPSLPFPPAGETLNAQTALSYPSIALFVGRISSIAPFTLSDDNAPIVADICRRLDGIPLAIELAASRVKVLSPRQVAERLDERFRILTGGSRTALPRQQTLRALIDWSHDLLDERERIVFRRSGIFAASFDLNAAIAVCADETIDEWDVVDVLDALADKSLVMVEPHGDERRYRLLESMRAYARERFRESGEEAATRARWFAHYRSLAQTFAEDRETNSTALLGALDVENDNLRSLLEWSIAAANDPVAGLQLAAFLGEYWVLTGLQPEGALWLEAGLRLVDKDSAKSTVAEGWLAVAAMGYNMMLGKSGLEAAQRAVQLGRECARPSVVAMGLLYSGIALIRLGRYAEADAVLGDAVVQLRAGGNRRSLVVGLISQAPIATFLGRERDARDLYEQALKLQHDTVPSHPVVVVRANLALLEFTCGNRERALELGREAVDLARNLSDASLRASTLVNLAAFLIDADRFDDARIAAREALELAHDRGYAVLVGIAIEHLALIAAIKGDLRTPARLIGYTDAALQNAGFVREVTEQRGYDKLMGLLRAGLSEAVLEPLLESGRALGAPEAVDLARDLIG